MEMQQETKKRVYKFGGKTADGNSTMKNLLGGKGANLAEMSAIGIPVPPGFTITTEVCTEYNLLGKDKIISLLKNEVEAAVAKVEDIMGTKFGSNENPCLLSVRSGARVSMPGMMDTVLNLGMNDNSVQGLIAKTGNERFAWDSYRRFVQMFGGVVLGVGAQSKEDHDPFEVIIAKAKKTKGVELDTDLDVEDLKQMVTDFKKACEAQTGEPFPEDPWDQLWGSITAVFDSWMNPRAIYYRNMHGYPEEWGTAVNVQAMVYGNMGNNSGTGVAFTRDAATGENIFNGEYLINAQGEDVVAGVRTPQQITLEGSKRWAILAGISEEDRKNKYPSLEELMPAIYEELNETQDKLEKHYKDMQDLEFTIQNGKLWMLQTRNGKRTAAAMVRIAIELLEDGMIDEKKALLMQEPTKLDELLHPVFDGEAIKAAKVLAKGLPASPGAATGQIVFFADEANKYPISILVRVETSPEDLEGMNIAKGILTARGGMTSHAAVVARGMGKCCVSGAGAVQINYKTRVMTIDGKEYQEGDWISLNGSTGEVYEGKIGTKDAELSGYFGRIMKLADKYRKLGVRTNAETERECKVAIGFGAEGIGLCRTEHMFFEGERLIRMREMILAEDEAGRREALDKLLPIQRNDFKDVFAAMAGLPVTVRLLDPPLHEFVPHEEENQKEMAAEMGISVEAIKQKVEDLKEFNPMLGHRGCRLGITYPEITEMQARAIIEAALELKAEGVQTFPEIMIPLIGTVKEFKLQEEIVRAIANKVFEEKGDTIDYLVGTMIEIPRAALTADKIAEVAEFFSFGTNDLTQMGFGYSRDDAGKFLPIYIEKGILKADPFQVLDQEGIGQLVEIGTTKGRSTNSKLKVGICGEHGGEPSSVEFCHSVGMDYVSCSPFRVPIARLAAAQAALKEQA
ncbi:pyruvate, phosphate dikinase [Lutibacter profundi]|uniref:Pyruvate, phosphate dikinase n=1 Tax=Lutibacter profundi TaxID=1622118 RepID=A0A0X8G4L6_9FLAO|nr:pyruvate, phosphate dikinase [Lutibacter profundi]AMC09966.1 pyruvate, phosphate dikinase [Lutibacter profundi]